MITYRTATPEYIGPALDLAMRVFYEFEAPDSETVACEMRRVDFTINRNRPELWLTGDRTMIVALDDNIPVAMVDGRSNGHIDKLYVDKAYQHRGIGTELLSRMVCELKLRGVNKVTLDSSPSAMPFFLKFGFSPSGGERKKDGFILVPMAYEPNEIWDVLDELGNKTGRYAERGRKMKTGDYHLVVHVWKRNGKGEWLIDKRVPRKTDNLGGKWETTGGSAVAGDDSLTAAIRETKEELGIDLDPEKGTLFCRFINPNDNGHSWIADVWVFEWDGSIDQIRLQQIETCDAMWATAEKIREMMAAGEFLGKRFYPYFDEMVEKWKIR